MSVFLLTLVILLARLLAPNEAPTQSKRGMFECDATELEKEKQ